LTDEVLAGILRSKSQISCEVQVKSTGCSRLSSFCGDLVTISESDSMVITHAMQHVLHQDQYKTMFGVPGILYAKQKYFLHMNHSLHGRFMLGALINFEGSDLICVGIVLTNGKFSKPNALLFDGANKILQVFILNYYKV
jgi:hypothetical protein